MDPEGTVVFTTNGLPYFGFDIFSISLPPNPQTLSSETRHTDGLSVNFNAAFTDDNPPSVVFVSERTGKAQLYGTKYGKAEASSLCPNLDTVFTDRPSVKNGRLYFVSAHEKPSEPFKSWAAVYETDIDSTDSKPVRLTPVGTADFSPALSQSGEFMAVASHGSGKWKGDFRELETDIVVFPVKVPNKRQVITQGGWPTWQGDSILFFHQKSEDGWWSVYRTDLTGRPATRVTPPGVHAFTPAASHDKRFIAVATRRKGKKCRHIELFNLEKEEFYPVTELTNPDLHHYNPFFSPESDKLGYHRFRGESSSKGDSVIPHLEPVHSPVQTLKMVRVNGTFPSFSPDGGLIAINGDLLTTPGLMVLKSDGSKRWTLIEKSNYFHTVWSPVEKGVIFTSVGPIFDSVKSTVQIARVSFNISDLHPTNDKVDASVKILTNADKGNNAFVSVSPDGKKIVFRSGRSGFKNLYIVDALNGEKDEIFRLTEGEWIDTMPSWSPNGELIAFSSNRHDPSDPSGFGLYLIRPDGSNLTRVHILGHENNVDLAKERINHVCFSPDSKWLLFTANFDSVLAETISGPNQFQPYGDLYACRVDGSGLVRLTCNAYENGTPAWHGMVSGLEALSIGETIGDKLRGQFEEPLWLTCDF